MNYPRFSKATEYRLSVPQANGGINAADAPADLENNQMVDACNLWWNEGVLRSRPVLRPSDSFSVGEQVGGLRPYAEETVFGGERGHYVELTSASKKAVRLVGVDNGGRFQADGGTLPAPSNGAVLYIPSGGSAGVSEPLVMIDGTLYRVTSNGYEEVEPYIPLLTIRAYGDDQNVPYTDEGYAFESRNLLTDAFRAQFVVNKGAVYFHLPVSALKAGVLEVCCTDVEGNSLTHTIKIKSSAYFGNGVYVEEDALEDGYVLTFSNVTRSFWFRKALPTGESVDLSTSSYATIDVTYQPESTACEGKTRIGKMTFGTWFGGSRSGFSGTRFFVSGNPEVPHLVHYSALNDPTYFPENSYVYIGASSDAVTAFGKQSDRLIIFKNREIYSAEYVSTPLDSDDALAGGVTDVETQSAAFPVTPLCSDVGCDRPRTVALCGNRLVWMTSSGKLYTLIGNSPYSQYSVCEIGSAITPYVRKYGVLPLQEATAVRFDDRYALLLGSHLWLLHGEHIRSLSSADGNTLRRQTAWYHWQLPCTPCAFFAEEARAVLLCNDTTADDVRLIAYTLENGDADILQTAEGKKRYPLQSYFRTKQFDFGYPERYKRVRLLSLEAGGDGDAAPTLSLQFEDENGTARDVCLVQVNGRLPTRVFTGMRRVLRFAVHSRAEGAVKYDGLTLLYSFYLR